MPRHNAALNAQRDAEHQTNVDRAIRDATGSTNLEPDDNVYMLDPEGARALRGIPAVGGRGTLGGHITDTRPDHLPFAIEYRTRRARRL